MASIVQTNWQLVSNGQATTYNAPDNAKIRAARIRWRGRSITTWDREYKANENHGMSIATFPEVPDGYDFDECTASGSGTVVVFDSDTWPVRVRRRFLAIGSDGAEVTFYSNWHIFYEPGEASVSAYRGGLSSAYIGGTVGAQGGEKSPPDASGGPYDYANVTARTWGYRDVAYTENSRNIKATVAGQTVSGPSSLGNNVVSGYYDLPIAEGVTSIQLTHAVTGSGEVYYMLEVELQTLTPMWVMVDGQLREVEAAWTMVDGQLRQVDSLSPMVDGSPK